MFLRRERRDSSDRKPAGTITYSSKVVQIGNMLFAWAGDPSAPLALQQEGLDKAKKFVIRPKFGAEMELSREMFEQLLKV